MGKRMIVCLPLRDRLLFLHPETGERREVPIPGTPSPGAPGYLRMWDGDLRETRRLVGEAVTPAAPMARLRGRLFHLPRFLFVLPPDVQTVEEAAAINFGIQFCGARKCFVIDYALLLASPSDLTPYAAFWRTCRACVVSYLRGGTVVARRACPREGFGPEQLRAALRELSPEYDAGRTPLYIGNPEGDEPLAGEGIPVGLDQIAAHALEAAAMLPTGKFNRKISAPQGGR